MSRDKGMGKATALHVHANHFLIIKSPLDQASKTHDNAYTLLNGFVYYFFFV